MVKLRQQYAKLIENMVGIGRSIAISGEYSYCMGSMAEGYPFQNSGRVWRGIMQKEENDGQSCAPKVL
jgi:hypothetical protein